MFTFRGITEDGTRLERRVLRMLRDRHAMNIGEMRMRLGVDGSVMQKLLDGMLARGEIERLRPVGFTVEDYDFFRIKPSVPPPDQPGARRVLNDEKTCLLHVKLAGEAMACFAE